MFCVPDQLSPPFGEVSTTVGAVLSNVTEVPSVTEITWVPAFPDRSAKSIVKVTNPSVSALSRTNVAPQVLPLPFTATELAGLAPPTMKVTVGVPMPSLAVKLSVTVSPTFAISFAPSFAALSESIVTFVREGTELSTMKYASEVSNTRFPAPSHTVTFMLTCGELVAVVVSQEYVPLSTVAPETEIQGPELVLT